MKKNFLILIVLIIVGTSCEEKLDIDAEKKAIIAVLEDESNAVINMDYAHLSDTWLQDESAIFLISGKDDYNSRYGFEEIGSWLREGMEKSTEPWYTKMEKANLKIKVYNKCAWTVYDEINYRSEDEASTEYLATKILEKTNGEWKIVYTSVVRKSSYKEEVEEIVEEHENEDTE